MKKCFTRLPFFICLTTSTLVMGTQALADDASHFADGHAPINVMGDHFHKQGEVMFSYRHKTMKMNELQQDGKSVNLNDVYSQGYMMAPKDMKGEMHMLGAMYAPSDKVTLMAMVPYVEKSMTIQNRMGRQFDTETSGIGDVKLGAIFPVRDTQDAKTNVSAVLSVPTGSIDEKVDTPMGKAHAPYNMQLGTGSYDLKLSATNVNYYDQGSIGAQFNTTIRTNKNSNGYRHGHEAEAKVWTAYRVTPDISVSLGINASAKGKMSGEDDKLPMMAMAPTQESDNQGGHKVSLSAGTNFKVGEHNRLAIAAEMPIHQDLEGIQMETDSAVTIGWQASF